MIALGSLTAIILLIGVLGYWMLTSFDDICGNKIVATAFSPDRAVKAVLFERDCGATTGFSSQVSVLEGGATLPDDGGNVFIANESEGGESTSWGGPFVALNWRDAHTLELTHESWADIRFKADKLDDVVVVYKTAP
ncbi:MAG TPA: hypothetical protein VGM59_16435 [Dongiaceae bacterium]